MAHLLASEHLVRGLLMKINTQPTLHADAVLCFLQYLSADKEDLCTNHCLFFFLLYSASTVQQTLLEPPNAEPPTEENAV